MLRMVIHPGAGLIAAELTLADGRVLRHVHAGAGQPVVVFEAGLGACASEWVTVQRLVSATTRTVSYDRAGYAGSSPDQQERTLDRVCEDLDALVQHVADGRPVVLVAHSWGGPIVRCYAATHPERVAGLVMVDTTTTAVLPERAAKSMPLSLRISRRLNRVMRHLVRRSLLRNIGSEVTEDDRAVILRDMTAKQSTTAAIAEARFAAASLPLMSRWEQHGLPHVPVISLVGAGTGAHAKTRRTLIEGAQAEMALHPMGECRVIDGTDHYVPQDKPVETARVILDVVERVRSGGR
jgi:pimeloyl-ACP methyl ester carboxylesterase